MELYIFLCQVSEPVLVDFSEQFTSICVLTRYQEMSSYSLGWSVTAAKFCSCHCLLLTARGVTRISQCFQKGFFGLECDSVVRGRRPGCWDVSSGEDHDAELEVESDIVDSSLWARDLQLLWPFMSLKVKRLSGVQCTYQLLAQVSTTIW